jgi:4-hydroxy-tetrahydrodipicolinate synthase
MTTSSPTPFAESIADVGVTPATPFTADLSGIDVGGLRANISFLLDHGVRMLYPCGNTGEFPSLSIDEWTTVVETVVEVCDGRAAVAPGVGHNLPVASEMMRRAASAGADGVLLMPVHQPYLAQAGLHAYYAGVLEAAPLPAVLYKRDPWPSDAGIPALAALDQVVGVKYAGTDVLAFSRLTAADAAGVVWTCGRAEGWAPFFSLAGSRGFTSGLANAAPWIALELQAALTAGDYETAMRLRTRTVAFEDVRSRDGEANNVPAVKAAMDATGLAGGPVRAPMRPLDDQTHKEISAIVAEWQDGRP